VKTVYTGKPAGRATSFKQFCHICTQCFWKNLLMDSLSPAINFTVLLNIFLSRLSPYMDEIIVNHRYWICCNRSTSDDFLQLSDTGEKMGEQ
jgi:hypothetical protein